MYTLADYERDAEALLRERLAELRTRGMGLSIEPALRDGATFDPAYAAKWSALARKYKAGYLIQMLIKFAEDYDVDMTPTFGSRVLEGWVGRSVSNRMLIDVFGKEDRDASQKSADWHRLDELIELDKKVVVKGYDKCAAKCKDAKERMWNKIQIKTK